MSGAASLYVLLALAAGIVIGFALGAALGVARNARLRAELAVRTAEIANRAALETERERSLEFATQRLSGVFGQLANQQFQSHSETFLRLARESLSVQNERARGDLAAREQAIEGLVRPIRDALTRSEQQMQELDKARRETYGNISAQLESLAQSQQALSAETRNLVGALRRPEVRGQWGEITLRRLVELAGMVEHCDFESQSHRATENGAIRPDMVIHLPEGRDLVVDVKTPLDAYLEATEARGDPERRAALDRHAAIVGGRVRELASKSYWSQFEKSPEFVILFIPGDQFLGAALAQKPELLDEALRQNIILATPTSLVALLKAIAYGWQQTALAENASEIRGLAVQLYERLTTFAAHVNETGKALSDSVKAFNRSVGSLERMVLPGARRFTDLGVQPRQRLPALKEVDETPRESAAADGAPGGGEGSAEPVPEPAPESPTSLEAPPPAADRTH